MPKISDVLRHADQQERERIEQERRKAEAERLAAIEERYLKRVLGGAILARAPSISRLCPHPNDAGRKPPSSPAGEVADKGRKWGGCLPGSFETGKRR